MVKKRRVVVWMKRRHMCGKGYFFIKREGKGWDIKLEHTHKNAVRWKHGALTYHQFTVYTCVYSTYNGGAPPFTHASRPSSVRGSAPLVEVLNHNGSDAHYNTGSSLPGGVRNGVEG
jgi:hypothetical protein